MPIKITVYNRMQKISLEFFLALLSHDNKVYILAPKPQDFKSDFSQKRWKPPHLASRTGLERSSRVDDHFGQTLTTAQIVAITDTGKQFLLI